MIATRIPSVRPIGLMALVLAFGGLMVGSAGAVTAEQRAACTPDALRLCSSEIPDMGRVKACMIANRDNLSQRCKATFGGAPAATPRLREAAKAAGPIRLARAEIVGRPHAGFGHPRYGQGRGDYALRAGRHRSYARAGYGAPGYGGGLGSFGYGRRHGAQFTQAMMIAGQVMSRLQTGCATQSVPAQLCQYQQMIPAGMMGSFAGAYGGY